MHLSEYSTTSFDPTLFAHIFIPFEYIFQDLPSGIISQLGNGMMNARISRELFERQLTWIILERPESYQRTGEERGYEQCPGLYH